MRKAIFLALAVTCLLSTQAMGGLANWTDTVGNSDWGNPANWDTGVVPCAGTDVTFGAATASGYVIVGTNYLSSNVVGTVTLSADQDFTVSFHPGFGLYACNRLTVNGNIIADGAANPHNYHISADHALVVTNTLGGGRQGTITLSGAGTHLIYVGTGHSVNFNNTGYNWNWNQVGYGYANPTWVGDGSLSGAANVTASLAGSGTINFWGAVCVGGLALSTTTVFNNDVVFDTITGLDQADFSKQYGYFVPFGVGLANTNSTWSQTYTGCGIFRKIGSGVMTVTGSINLQAGWWATEVQVVNGTLRLDKSGDTALTGQLPAGFGINAGALRAATFQDDGNDTIDSTDSINQIRASLGGGEFFIVVNHGSAANNTLTINSGDPLSVNGAHQGMIRFMGLGGSGAYTSQIVLAGAPGGQYANGSYGYGFIGDEFVSFSGTTETLNNVLVPLDAAGRPNDIGLATANDNVLVTAPQGTPIASGTTVINSLKIASADSIDLGGNVLNIRHGGIIKTAGTAASTISNGTLFMDNTGTGTGYNSYFEVLNEGDLTINANLKYLIDAGSWSATGLNKAGAGKLTLAGTWQRVPVTGTSDNNKAFHINWFEGDLTYEMAATAVLDLVGTGAMTGVRPGKLTVNGTGALTICGDGADYSYINGIDINGNLNYGGPGVQGNVYGAAGVLIGGTVSLNAGGQLRLSPNGYNKAYIGRIYMNGGTLCPTYGTSAGPGLGAASVLDFAAGVTSRIQSAANNANANVYGLAGSGSMEILPSNTTAYAIVFNTQTGSSSGFTGNIIIDSGAVLRTANNTTSWPGNPNVVTTINPGGYLELYQNYSITGQTFAGGGVIHMYGNLTSNNSYTLSPLNMSFAPSGTGTGGVGIMKFEGNLTFSTTYASRICLDVTHGAGASAQPVAGVDYDQFQINRIFTSGGVLQTSGTTNRLAGLDLSINIAAKRNFLGNSLTLVLSGSTDFTGAALHGVTFNNTGFADITVGGTSTAGG
ncbi:MAG: hypothetical protein ACE15C_21760, partial [Phycisphaerae bacterium]